MNDVTGKVRLEGVLFIGWFYIISSLISLIANLPYSIRIHSTHSIIHSILNILAILIGYNILKLKEFWRKLNLYYCFFMIAELIIYRLFSGFSGGDETFLIYLIFYVIVICYFTRLKVKAHFKI